METKFTKGEWKVDSGISLIGDTNHYTATIRGTNEDRYESIAFIMCCSHIRDKDYTIHSEEAEANAKLIAAAPFLFESLQWIAHHAMQGGCSKESLKSVAEKAIEKATK